MKGSSPTIKAKRIHPSAQISKAGEAPTFFVKKISGGKYDIDPAFVISDFLPEKRPAIPKSTILTSFESLDTFSMFSSFKSQ